VHWGSAAVTRIRTRETSGSTDPRPSTGCAVGEDLETTSVSGRGAVQQDSSILRLAEEDPDATLLYNPRRWTSMDPNRDINRNVSLISQSLADNAHSFALSSQSGADGHNLTYITSILPPEHDFSCDQ